MTKNGILASAATKERLQQLIQEYFVGNTAIVITDDGTLYNTRKGEPLRYFKAEKRSGRWYFKIEPEG